MWVDNQITILRLLASYEAKIAKICNIWTFWPVIQHWAFSILYIIHRLWKAGLLLNNDRKYMAVYHLFVLQTPIVPLGGDCCGQLWV